MTKVSCTEIKVSSEEIEVSCTETKVSSVETFHQSSISRKVNATSQKCIIFPFFTFIFDKITICIIYNRHYNNKRTTYEY